MEIPKDENGDGNNALGDSMIYSPSHYKEERRDLIYEVLKDFPFATVITVMDEVPIVSHLPLLFENNKTLLGPCARANPHWRQFADGQTVTAIFHGPHSYISPAWYRPKSDNVPTWNYLVVHARGKVTIVEDQNEMYAEMVKMVNHLEEKYKTL